MDIHTFIANYQEAFGQHAELPIAFWYSDRMEASGKSSVSCPLKPSDSAPLKHSTMPP